ncbi:hypothetical protein Pth03_48670 [Planotetraspora thailandica]|uniref:DUF320 domain-containing protein n=1 Tax=Planotetraspora thailandica TaxID=487172 RepID=A0A8J3XZ61_9ACTN|nr:hypothetical protein [Planotetraspora thailandica]GII56478.1 hypothetical protein Pth03_48670 [Planotetraspora thailandica]
MAKAAATVALTVGIAGMFAAPAQAAAEKGGTYSHAGSSGSMEKTTDVLSTQDLDLLSILPILGGITPSYGYSYGYGYSHGHGHGITQGNGNAVICGGLGLINLNLLSPYVCEPVIDQVNTTAMDPAMAGHPYIDQGNDNFID